MAILRLMLLSFILSILVNNQNAEAQSSRLKSLFQSQMETGNMLFEEKEYIDAIKAYKKVLKKTPQNLEAILKIADSYRILNDFNDAQDWYGKAIEGRHKIPAVYKRYYAEVLLVNGHKNEASLWLEKYLQDEKNDEIATNLYNSIRSYDSFYKDSLSSTVKELNVNSLFSDFCPMKYGNGLLFLSSRDEAREMIKYTNSSDQSSFYSLYYWESSNDSIFFEPKKYVEFDYAYHEGPLSFFDSGNKVIYSRTIKSSKGKDAFKLGLFYAEKSGSGKWSKGQLLPFIDDMYSYSHPFYDTRTHTLYFASDMPGGYGATDLYKIKWVGGQWVQLENLGPDINTIGNDLFPFLSSDTCLYFSSNGHPGMGGLDLFKVDLKDKVLIVENLGFPANSSYDDFALIIENDLGYFSSNRKNGGRDDDLYEVEFHWLSLNIHVYDRLRKLPQGEASLQVVDETTGKKTEMKNKNGEFSFLIKPGRDYKLLVSQKDYRTAFAHINIDSREEKIIHRTIYLDKDNRTYVKGQVVHSSVVSGGDTVYLVDLYSNSTSKIVTDSLGKFICEISKDTTNIFYIEKDGLHAISRLEPVKTGRKGSGFTFVKLYMGDITKTTVSGNLFDREGNSLPLDTVFFKNELNKEENYVVSDHNGKFSIELWEDALYSIYLKNDNFAQHLDFLIPGRKKNLDLIKKQTEEQ